MGVQMKSRYEDVGREFGAVGRMKLAMLTKIPSTKAEETQDSAANLKLMDEAIAEIRKSM